MLTRGVGFVHGYLVYIGSPDLKTQIEAKHCSTLFMRVIMLFMRFKQYI